MFKILGPVLNRAPKRSSSMPLPAREKPVKLNIVNAIELKPEANYILVADNRQLSRPDMEKIMTDLRKAGVRNVVSFLMTGNPQDAVQLISKEKKHATSKTRH